MVKVLANATVVIILKSISNQHVVHLKLHNDENQLYHNKAGKKVLRGTWKQSFQNERKKVSWGK